MNFVHEWMWPAGGSGGIWGDVLGTLIWVIIAAIVTGLCWPPARRAINAWMHGHFERHRAITAEREKLLHAKLDHIIKYHPDIPDFPESGAATVWVLGALAGVVFVVLALVFWHDTSAWFLRYTGSNDEGGPIYGFVSGTGGAIPDLLILGSIVTFYRHANCHVKGCPRIGKPVDGTPYRACHVHHPDHEGDSRNVSLETITHAHARAKAEAQAPA